jgi:hypothetical protein
MCDCTVAHCTVVAVGPSALCDNARKLKNSIKGAPWGWSLHDFSRFLWKCQGVIKRRGTVGNPPVVTEAVSGSDLLPAKSQRRSTHATDPPWVEARDIHPARVLSVPEKGIMSFVAEARQVLQRKHTPYYNVFVSPPSDALRTQECVVSFSVGFYGGGLHRGLTTMPVLPPAWNVHQSTRRKVP